MHGNGYMHGIYDYTEVLLLQLLYTAIGLCVYERERESASNFSVREVQLRERCS